MINDLNLKEIRIWIFPQQEPQLVIRHGESQHWDLLWYVQLLPILLIKLHTPTVLIGIDYRFLLYLCRGVGCTFLYGKRFAD